MKTLGILFVLSLFISTQQAYASDRYEGRINCEGKGEIEGAFGIKKKQTTFYFNYYKPKGEHHDLQMGHKVDLGKKAYTHIGIYAVCKYLDDSVIECTGSGHGNGPKLSIEINLNSGLAKGSYFNPWMWKMSYSNEANTYIYREVTCEFLD